MGKFRKEATCQNCHEIFTSKKKVYKGRDIWDKCCSMECRREFEKECWFSAKCPTCGKSFKAYKSKQHTGRGKFCSVMCHGKFKTSQRTFKSTCLCCGKETRKPNSRETSLKFPMCSRECWNSYNSREKSSAWKGGWWLSEPTGQVRVCIGMSKSTYKSHPYGHPVYTARYRVLVEIKTGHILPSSMPVLHINGITIDDRLSNLYICRNTGEMTKMRLGTIAYPVKSNIMDAVFDGKIKYRRYGDDIITSFIKDSSCVGVIDKHFGNEADFVTKI